MNTPGLSSTEFEKVTRLIYRQAGIKLDPCKKILVESRLNRRLRALKYESYDQYIQYLTSSHGMEQELVHMIDVITTNKTDFFREPHHFQFLYEHLLPRFVEDGSPRPYRVWSSACSTGEEPYTLAMVMQDFANINSRFSYQILASDISTQVLEKARTAIYNEDRIADIAMPYRKKYLLKSKDVSAPRVRIVPELREKIEFFRLNLIEDAYDVAGGLDAIFCRNVLIYFDRETQYKVIVQLIEKLKPGGILFIGHSESLHFFNLPIKQIKPTIFLKH